MTLMSLVVILFRWIHIIAACVAIGGTVFIRLILPVGLKVIDDESVRHAVFLKCRRVFKMTIHPAIFFLLLSGIFNAMRNWPIYSQDPGSMHPLFGMHMLFALIAICIALYVLAGKEPPAKHRKLVLANLVVLALAVASASALKWAREQQIMHPKTLQADVPAVAHP